MQVFLYLVSVDLNLQKKKYQFIFLVGIGCGVAIWFEDLNDNLHPNLAAFILFVGKIKNK